MTDSKGGKAWVFGDDVNTDYIISSKRKRDTLDVNILAAFLMEDIRPGFGNLVRSGDFLVGGKNFGCGSAMEIATEVIKGAGIRAVLAKSFSRTFFRNGVNGGLLMLTLDTDPIAEGDVLSLEQAEGRMVVRNLTKDEVHGLQGGASALGAIVTDGGLIAHLKKNKGFALNQPD